MANRLLPPLNYFDDTQIEQLGRLYLWKIIGEYAKQNVFIVRTRYRTGDGVSIDGFNDSQTDQIMVDLLRHFKLARPPVLDRN